MKILVFPKVSNNPYQELLYAHMRARGVVVDYLNPVTKSGTINLLTWIPRLVAFRMKGYDVFHLHWVSSLSLKSWPWTSKFGRTLLYLHYLLFLKSIKILGYKFVWTAHNVLPHEEAFVDDLGARIYLSAQTDLVIAHSDDTIMELAKLGLIMKRTIVIPHGNYVEFYQNKISKEQALKTLGIRDEMFIYLFLGRISEYKGMPDLLEAFVRIKNKDDLLLIAGECEDSTLDAILRKYNNDPQIQWHDGRVADEDVQIYFATADVVVLPFKIVTTSGSALLALSFGKAVIVPAIGDLARLPESVAYKYESGREGALEEKMIEVGNNPDTLRQKSLAAKAYAESFSWTSIAEKTHEAMENLFR